MARPNVELHVSSRGQDQSSVRECDVAACFRTIHIKKQAAGVLVELFFSFHVPRFVRTADRVQRNALPSQCHSEWWRVLVCSDVSGRLRFKSTVFIDNSIEHGVQGKCGGSAGFLNEV
jgi:hypothetical protein